MQPEAIYNEIIGILPEINIEEEADIFKDTPNVRQDLLDGLYYRALAAYCKIHSPKNILEIGTCSGASVACLSKYADKITTMDVDLSNVKDFPILEKRGVTFKKVNPEEILSIDYSEYDFIFIDIDHTGFTEKLLHKRLLETYKGVVFWDDILINDGMKDFWEKVEVSKFTTYLHNYGFGIVKY